jgi:2-polyprenyl-6-methoxyphenol hydroxylase-like FAD-dependent oxidoreductase
MDSTDEVLIVGAGPTGLLLAGDLAAAGVACTVLERRADESNLTRAFAVHARTLELLDARGIADDLVATGTAVGTLRLFGKFQLDLSRLPSRFPFVLMAPPARGGWPGSSAPTACAARSARCSACPSPAVPWSGR